MTVAEDEDGPAIPPVIVLGTGGHAAVLIEALQQTGRVVLGCLSPGGATGDAGPLGTEILGDDTLLVRYQPGALALVNGVGSTDTAQAPGGLVRHHLHRTWHRRSFVFASVIHPAATIAAGCELAAGVQVMAGAVVQTGTQIGAGSIVNTGACIDHHCSIGELVHIAPGATLCGGVTVGDGAFVGAGATVIPGVIIGAGARIGAGMTILADVPEGARLAPPSAGATTIKPDGAAAEACSPEIRFAATNP